MSELELSLFRQRSQEALKQKARRGALFLGVAAGYVRAGRDRIEKDPDQRVQDALRLVFAKFAELQSVRQVHVWLRDEGIALPVDLRMAGRAQPRLEAAALQHRAQHSDQSDLCRRLCLWAHDEQGAASRMAASASGAACGRPMAEWDVLIKDHHEGYITWERVREEPAADRRQRDRQSSATARGAVRRGETAAGGAPALWALRPQAACAYGGKASAAITARARL